MFIALVHTITLSFTNVADVTAPLERETRSFILLSYLIVPLLILETTDESVNFIFGDQLHRNHHRSVHPCG